MDKATEHIAFLLGERGVWEPIAQARRLGHGTYLVEWAKPERPADRCELWCINGLYAEPYTDIPTRAARHFFRTGKQSPALRRELLAYGRYLKEIHEERV